ncbi:hypothetical protein PI125_g6318 [Phytophthora idaei]|nr:hypothetical protein PI125_g6318 [Phytophthora idaei]KAG3150330.1 hypothetical protein PI126_g11555 [Phytophthora idaei]
MIHVSQRDKERVYLRVMLSHRRGPTSFEDLRTVDGVVYPTFQAAAQHGRYLDDDVEKIERMSQAAGFQMPYQLRQPFATLLVYSMPTDVRGLWDRFYKDLSEDFSQTYRDLLEPLRSSTVMFKTLHSIQELLQVSRFSVHDFDLPQLNQFPRIVLESLPENTLIHRELTAYNESALEEISESEDQLNPEQKDIYDRILGAVDQPELGTKLFFIDRPGGTGKSTLLHHLFAKVRLDGKIAIAVASSGIASLLLMGGRTVHSTFKISLKLNDKSTCSIYKQSHLRKLIDRASLAMWDVAPMTHRYAFKAVDRTLRDIMGNDRKPFGGNVFVLSGDFRQILPVVKRGTPAETIDACLKSSELWRHFQQLHLAGNMRVRSAGDTTSSFSEVLLQVGEGRHDVNPALGQDFMKIPKDMVIDNPPAKDTDDEEIAPDMIPKVWSG